VNGERAGTRAAPVSDTAVEGPTSSVIAEEDETLYARYDTARIPPAIPYIAPDDLPVPSDDLSDPDLPYWLALNRVKGIGPARFRLLLDAFGSAAEIWRGSPQAWRAAGLDARTTEAFERQRPTIAPDAELERLIRLRVRAIRFIDPGYPKLLSEIPLPPAILYVRGAVTAEDEWALAVVGTRRASAYGRQMTERLVRELAAQRITIVSGLARHRLARACGGARRWQAHHRGARLWPRPGLSSGERAARSQDHRAGRAGDGVRAGCAALETLRIRAMPPHEREARFHSARLRRRLSRQEEVDALQQLGLSQRVGRRVYQLREHSREVKLRQHDFNVALAPERDTGFLDRLARDVTDGSSSAQAAGFSQDTRTRMESLTGVTVAALDRERRLIALDPNKRWPNSLLDDLEAAETFDLSQDAILDPVYHDYFTKKP
jgi:hypothetical protein